MLYPNMFYNEVCYKGTAMYFHFIFLSVTFYNFQFLKIRVILANSVELDQLAHSAPSHQGINCLSI